MEDRSDIAQNDVGFSELKNVEIGFSQIVRALERAADPWDANFSFPGAVMLVAKKGEVLFHHGVGLLGLNDGYRKPVTSNTIYDTASLTKALVTTTLVMKAVDSGLIKLDQRIGELLPVFDTPEKGQITIRHLLSYSSGLVAFSSCRLDIEQLEKARRRTIRYTPEASMFLRNQIASLPLECKPGNRTVYNNSGSVVLEQILESIYGGVTLDVLFAREITRPLKLKDIGFYRLHNDEPFRSSVDLGEDISMVAPTTDCLVRGYSVQAEPHDFRAWIIGGVAGHAGLFAAAEPIYQIANELVRCWKGEGTLVSQKVVREFWKRDGSVPGSTWALGWDTPNEVKSCAGTRFGPNSVGHLGFTGCSIWIDPDPEVIVILLSNRVHPSEENEKIRTFRPMIHDLVRAII